MIIRIGNVSLLPWTYRPYKDEWVRWEENDSPNRVLLIYNKFGAKWSPFFGGSLNFLYSKFEDFGTLDNHKYKHHEKAMEQMDRFLIRMGKLTIFM